MSFTEAISAVLGKYAVFSGRARRSEYWWWVLFQSLLLAVVQLAVFAIWAGDGNAGLAFTLLGIINLGLLLPSLGVFIRRLHDTGRSGWWFWIGLIPLIGFIVLLVFLVQEGDAGPNEYGDPVV